jgi:fucose 4-O-acetylase-like acetyltransferase
MTDQQRLVYPDICKFVAIFIVTCSHCAQCISGEIWTNFLGGSVIDIAFTMPLFMLLSGWFLNLEKYRSANITKFIIAKFKRLMIPAMSWYIIYCLLTNNKPSFNEALLFYWYLTSLFICLCIILFFPR